MTASQLTAIQKAAKARSPSSPIRNGCRSSAPKIGGVPSSAPFGIWPNASVKQLTEGGW